MAVHLGRRVGATKAGDWGLEFILSTLAATSRAVELLAMVVRNHRGGRLGLGHTVPIGELWLPGSACDYLLISRPYPFGPDLETCHVGDRHVAGGAGEPMPGR